MTSRKRFRKDLTTFEILPNEVLLEIFNYLSDVDIIYTFSRLNKRFQCLLLHECSYFDFQSVSKTKFDYIIRHHDIHRWRALRLSDNDDTPGQVTYFYQLFSMTENRSQLEALSIINMNINTSSLLLSNLPSFDYLVSLSIGSFCGKNMPLMALLKLKYLVIQSCMYTNWMKRLELKSLQHTIEHHCNHEHSLIWPVTLEKLKVVFKQTSDNDIILDSLKYLYRLSSLSIYGTAWKSPAPDGQLWENLIRSSMPLLKKFKFCFKFWRDFNLASDLKHIISTFSTPFYLKEKSWFVQCDAHRQQFSIAILYSLPFAFEHFEIVTKSFDESLSTWNNCSNNDLIKTSLYKNVKQLTVNVICEKIDKTLMPINVVELNFKISSFSIDWIISMKQLHKLSLGHQFNMPTNDFIQLLKKTHLRSLVISYRTLDLLTDQWKNKIVCKLLSQKIRSLEISSANTFPVNTCDYVNVNELPPIVRTFSKRCRNLNITVYSRNIVSGFILRNMKQLRSLKVRLHENDKNRNITKEWLIEQDDVYKNLDYSIVEDGNEYSFWLGHRK